MYNLGLKALKRLATDGNGYQYYRAKLTKELFKGEEQPVFDWVDQHFRKYQQVPTVETLVQQFPVFLEFDTPEPAKYYLDLLEQRYEYEQINRANIRSQELLKADKSKVLEARTELEQCLLNITTQRYRQQILNVNKEAADLVMKAYHKLGGSEVKNAVFGWPYMDEQTGGVMPGEVVSIVGRPARGKTYCLLHVAKENWQAGISPLFVSMEMDTLPLAQRIAAMYGGTNITQLKTSSYSTQTYKIFSTKIKGMADEPVEFYVINGNLIASVDESYALAQALKCRSVFFDGAYLLRHSNPKFDRYTRVAENVELMKRCSTDLEMPTFASWQFNRNVGKTLGKQKSDDPMENIGYSDAIGQISGIVLAMLQDESVETLIQRRLDVLKGRNGEIGSFNIHWDFNIMNFNQVLQQTNESEKTEIEWV